jgi:hypothetical protein
MLARAASAAARPAIGSVRPTGIGPRRATRHGTERGLRSLGVSCLMREAIRGHQKPSEAIRGHQRPSQATRGHQRPSEAIRDGVGTTAWSRLPTPISSASSNQRPSEAIRGRQRPSEAIRGRHRPSAYPLPSHQLAARDRDGAR